MPSLQVGLNRAYQRLVTIFDLVINMAKKKVSVKKVVKEEVKSIGPEIDRGHTVFIGEKDEFVYLKACLYVLKRNRKVAIKARYSKFLKAINVYFELMEMINPNFDNKVNTIASFWVTPYEKDGVMKESKELQISIISNGK